MSMGINVTRNRNINLKPPYFIIENTYAYLSRFLTLDYLKFYQNDED